MASVIEKDAGSQVIDKIETALILAMDANFNKTRRLDGRKSVNATNLGLAPMFPQSFQAINIAEDGRLLGETREWILRSPQDIIGSRSEVGFFGEKGFSWNGFRITSNPPKSIVFDLDRRKISHIYELHVRSATLTGSQTYHTFIFGFTKYGEIAIGRHAINMHRFLNLLSPIKAAIYSLISAIEDCGRTNAMTASVTDGVTMTFPVPLDNYKKIFLDRDGPMAGARRKAIIHWVAKHLRMSHRGNVHEVKRHVRGVDRIVIDGLTISITPNDQIP